ncbi:YveK family protein [Weissella cibaria]|uniref:YveK family protein n=1 Tax=Weissella cibaria TaxID=137591 RepID=UPI001C1F470D|nr:Wzz/FepE/Etk N-terminal domain-containing protein [Weissella cibaria]MBU7545398.1 capsular biosynthesis protein [Weissella cibaria]MCV3318707.1 Wzz/FepE/Etk N-terminal domain-containing protein [Weissella cibaria]
MDNVFELNQMWQIIKKYFWGLIFMAIIGAGVGYSIAKFAIAPTYSSSTSMLVNRTAAENSTPNANLSDQQADVQLISTYKNLITSSNVLGTVSDKLAHPSRIVVKKAREAVYQTLPDGTNVLVTPAQEEVSKPSNKKRYKLSVDDLKDMVSISSQPNSQVFSIDVKSNNSQLSANIANEVADVFKDKIGNFMKINNVSIIDKATENTKPVSPNVKLFTFAGFVIFAGLSFLFVLIKELTDTTIKSSDEVVELLGITNLGTISYIKPIKNFSMNVKQLSDSENVVHRSRLYRKK